MTDEDRDALLLELKKGQERLESGQAEILRILRGQATGRTERDEYVSSKLQDHDDRIIALEKAAG